MLRKDL